MKEAKQLHNVALHFTMVKKPTITETIRLNRLSWFGHRENKNSQKSIIYEFGSKKADRQTKK